MVAFAAINIFPGCNGGDEGTAFRYVVRKGLARESRYSYKGRDASCNFHSSYAVAHMSNYGRVRRGDEDELKWVVAKMVVTLDSSRVLQFNISTKQ